MRVSIVSFQCFPSTPLPLKKQAIAAIAHRFGQGSQTPARSCALRMVWKRGHPMISRVITIFQMTIFWINKPWQLISLQTLPFDCWTKFTLSDHKTEFKAPNTNQTRGMHGPAATLPTRPSHPPSLSHDMLLCNHNASTSGHLLTPCSGIVATRHWSTFYKT